MDASQNGIPLTMNNARGVLWDTILDLRAGKVSAASANGVSNAVGKILASVRSELDYYKAIGKTPNIEMIPGLPALGAAEPNGITTKGKS